MLPVLGLPAPSSPSHLPHLHLQSLPCCQSTVLKFIRAVTAGYRVPGKITLDWLPSLLLLLWHAEKMLIGPNPFDTKGETACSRHKDSCHPFSRGTGWILPVHFCLPKRSWPGTFKFDRTQTGITPALWQAAEAMPPSCWWVHKDKFFFSKDKSGILFSGGLWCGSGKISVRALQ